MKAEHARRLAVRLGSVVISLLAAGCSSAASPPTANTYPAMAQARTASTPAHSGRKLYIALTGAARVLVYSTGSHPTLLQTITDGVPRPGGLWVNGQNVLYAVNVPGDSYQTSLPEYKPGASTPFKIITDGIVNVSNVADDNESNVYVTGVDNSNGSSFLEVYPKGSLSPSETLTLPKSGLARPAGLAFDSSGALLVGESVFGNDVSAVYRLPPGSRKFRNLGLQKAPGGAIAVDGFGNLYAGGDLQSGGYVAAYAPNSQTPSRTIKIHDNVTALTVDPNGGLYVGTPTSVEVYAPGAMKPSTTLDIGGGSIGGLALSSQR